MSKKDQFNLGILFVVQTIPLITLVSVFISPTNKMIRFIGLGLSYLLATFWYEKMVKEYPNIRKKPRGIIKGITWSITLVLILWLLYMNYKELTLRTIPVFAIIVLAFVIIVSATMFDRIQAIREIREQKNK